MSAVGLGAALTAFVYLLTAGYPSTLLLLSLRLILLLQMILGLCFAPLAIGEQGYKSCLNKADGHRLRTHQSCRLWFIHFMQFGFVLCLVDLKSHIVVGTGTIVAAVGLGEPLIVDPNLNLADNLRVGCQTDEIQNYHCYCGDTFNLP
jgi:hypothetical protein